MSVLKKNEDIKTVEKCVLISTIYFCISIKWNTAGLGFNILLLYMLRMYVLNADETSPHNVPVVVVVAAKSCPQ